VTRGLTSESNPDRRDFRTPRPLLADEQLCADRAGPLTFVTTTATSPRSSSCSIIFVIEDVWSLVFSHRCCFKPGRILLRQSLFVETKHRCGPAQDPKWSNQKIDGVLEEGGLISFDRVSDKLQDPADAMNNSQRPAPVEKEERQRDDNQRYPDAVREPVQRMLMLGFVVSEKSCDILIVESF
jgi:hypothetical protein